jgi:acyl-CoA thioester hydrolase
MTNQQVFYWHTTVKPFDIDELGHVNNVVYLRWVQEAAEAHWKHIASVDMQKKYIWVVLRHEIDYKNQAFLYDEINAHTWVGEYRGARFERFVNLSHAKDNKMLAMAKTTWCLLDASSMKPTRVTEEFAQLFK